MIGLNTVGASAVARVNVKVSLESGGGPDTARRLVHPVRLNTVEASADSQVIDTVSQRRSFIVGTCYPKRDA